MPAVASGPRSPATPVWLVALLSAIYLLTGLIGHDPWKTDDAIHLGIAHGILTGDGWLLPAIAGEPWPGTAPLYHWLAAALGAVTDSWLPFHDGARLATAGFGALYLAALAGAARQFHDREAALGAPLLAIGTLGLLVPIHDAQPAIAALAAGALAFWGAALLPRRPATAALMLGGGVGIAFLADGLDGLAPVLPLLILPLLQRRWSAAILALVTAGALVAAWPLALLVEAPGFLELWWAEELAQLGSHASTSTANPAELLAWFAWPVLPLAAWTLWLHRHRLAEPALAVPLFGAALALLWFVLHESRPLPALPLVTPLVLLAAAGSGRLRRGAANAFDWFAMTTFTLVALLIWLGASAMWTGWPQKIARNFAKLEPGFVGEFSLFGLAAALAATALWLALLVRLPRSPWRAASRWAGGVTVLWALLMALWLPWIDYGKTYRPVALSLRQALDGTPGCIARQGLGPAQRASFDYFAAIRTVPLSTGQECPWLLVQGSVRDAPWVGWEMAWEGHRPGDKTERFRLYRQN